MEAAPPTGHGPAWNWVTVARPRSVVQCSQQGLIWWGTLRCFMMAKRKVMSRWCSQVKSSWERDLSNRKAFTVIHPLNHIDHTCASDIIVAESLCHGGIQHLDLHILWSQGGFTACTVLHHIFSSLYFCRWVITEMKVLILGASHFGWRGRAFVWAPTGTIISRY